MKNLILLRGPSAVGKTAVAKSLILHIKDKLKEDCAYIAEDDFRKQMQWKYKSDDRIAHTNSVPLIKAVILELEKIDDYRVIVIEGLFRYKEMIEQYKTFCKENKYKLHIFQLTASLKVRKERNKLSAVRDHVVDFEKKHSRGDGEEIPVKDSIIIDTTQPIEYVVNEIVSCIKSRVNE